MTLVELLITIVVLSILLALGVPGLQDFIKNNRVTAQANDLVVAVQLARSEAVKRGTRGVICAKKVDKDECTDSDDWSTGWIVYSDVDQDGNLAPDPSGEDCINFDCIIRTRGALNKTTLDGAGENTIGFLPNGLVYSVAPYTLTLTADNCQKSQVRTITVTRRGHTNVTKQDCPP
mgnify:CR=1 FL=1